MAFRGSRAAYAFTRLFLLSTLHSQLATPVILRGAYTSGDLAGYAAAGDRMRARLEALAGRVLVAHHGDCDGMCGGALLAAFLARRGVTTEFASSAEFREKDLEYYEAAARGCSAAVFVEAQGMPPSYARLDPLFLNIDHHPHPDDTPIRRLLNPRRFAIQPNPAIGLVMYELLAEALPPAAGWLAAIASVMDYCPAPAERLAAAHPEVGRRHDELRDTFFSCQYVPSAATGVAAYLARLPAPEAFIAAEPFRSRRERFRALFAAALAAVVERRGLVFTELAAGEIRIASPLANTLSDRHPTKGVVVIENSSHTARFSVRCRRGGLHVGALLARLARELGAGDGTGHEAAGSARVPPELKPAFLSRLEETLG